MKLVLFDIDGTIIASGGAGEKALRLAVCEQFGVDHGLTGIEIAGRTDTGIVRQVFARHAERDEYTEAAAQDFLEIYLRYLGKLLPEIKGRLLPGLIPLLDALKERPDVLLGLLTGNVERGARLKLTHYGVWHYFKFGAFADVHHDRNQLAAHALEIAGQAYGSPLAPEQTYVLGDTPHDITCGKAIKARTVGVATGGYTVEQLRASQPDYLFADFSETAAVLSIFDHETPNHGRMGFGTSR